MMNSTGLRPLEEHPRAGSSRCATRDDQRQDQHAVGRSEPFAREDGYDIENGRQQLGARVEPVGERVAWEILAEGDVLQHTRSPLSQQQAAPPSAPRPCRPRGRWAAPWRAAPWRRASPAARQGPTATSSSARANTSRGVPLMSDMTRRRARRCGPRSARSHPSLWLTSTTVLPRSL